MNGHDKAYYNIFSLILAFNGYNCTCVRPHEVYIMSGILQIYLFSFTFIHCYANTVSPSNTRAINVHVRLYHVENKKTRKLDVNMEGLQLYLSLSLG